MLCYECPKRAICNTLCPEAELFASQDHVNQSELTASELEINLNSYNVPRWPYKLMLSQFTPQQWRILNMALAGFSYSDIAKIIKTSKGNVRVQVSVIRKKVNKPTIYKGDERT